MRTARAALALLLCFAIPVRAETTADPLWYLLSTYVLAPDAKAVEADGTGPADARGLAALQADLLVLTDGLEGFRDEAQVKETLDRLKPRMSPELRPFFKDRASSLDAIYRTLAVTDYTWAQRFPEPPCGPVDARRKLLDSRDGLFQTEKGEASPWLVSLLGQQSEGKAAEQALDQASSQAKLTGAQYEKLRARVRKLTMALVSAKAVGAARSKLYCSRAAAFTDLAASHRAKDAALILAGRAVVNKPEESVFVVVWKNQRAAATLLRSKNGVMLVTDAAIVADTDHPNLFAFSDNAKPVALAATVVRRHPELSVAVLSYSADIPRPALTVADKVPEKDDLVTAVGHTSISGLWTKTSGLVTKVGEVSFQTDAAISPELSGGPVLNEAGEVAGMLVLRPSDTEEGRWPVAIPAPVLARWLDDPANSFTPPGTEAIEDAGTAALLSRARPSGLTEAGLGDWNIPSLPPPPSAPNGVCVANCGGSNSSGSSNGSAELGQALGELGAVLILKGIPALFRGIGKLFKGKGGHSKPTHYPPVADAPVAPKPNSPIHDGKEPPLKKEPLPEPKYEIRISAVSSAVHKNDPVQFIAFVTRNRDDIPLANIRVDFAVEGGEPISGVTDASGRILLSVEQMRSEKSHDDLDLESRRHPQLIETGRKEALGACKTVASYATGAIVATILTASIIGGPPVLIAGGGACVKLAATGVALGGLSCAAIIGADAVLDPKRRVLSVPDPVPSDRAQALASGQTLTREEKASMAADKAQDDLTKAEQDNADEEGSVPNDDMTGPADPGTEPPEEEPSRQDDLRSQLNEAQKKKLGDFEKSLPKSAGKVSARDLPNGGKAFQADVPARNIPGSFARYEKQIDALGNTTSFTKTTFGPDGRIIHVRVTDGLEKKLFLPEP